MRPLRALLATAAIATAIPSTATAEDGAMFGAQIDRTRVTVACEALRALGSDATALSTSRGALTRPNGTYNFNGLDAEIDFERSCGIEPVLRIDTKTTAADEGLPADPDAYAQLLTALASHVDGRVRRYAIDNEISAEGHFPDTPEHYADLLRLSYGAIHAGDPDAIVVDGGMAYGALGIVQVDQLYRQGHVEEAIALANEVDANELGQRAPIADEAGLVAMLADEKAQRALRVFELLVANQAYFDAFQFHYYGPSEHLASMIQTTRDLGLTRPLEVWEVNHRYLDARPFDATEHAAEAARLLITSAGEGSQLTIYSSYYDNLDNSDLGLFDVTAGTERPAARAFAVVASKLAGATDPARLALSGGTHGYSFDRPGGEVIGVWNPGAAPRLGRGLGIRASSVAVTSAADGSVRHVSPKLLRPGPTPLLVEHDLLDFHKRRGGSHRAYKLELSCPSASPFAHCAGAIRGVNRLGHVVGRLRYRVRRGETERDRLKLDAGEPGPRILIADAKRCPSGKRHCRSRFNL